MANLSLIIMFTRVADTLRKSIKFVRKALYGHKRYIVLLTVFIVLHFLVGYVEDKVLNAEENAVVGYLEDRYDIRGFEYLGVNDAMSVYHRIYSDVRYGDLEFSVEKLYYEGENAVYRDNFLGIKYLDAFEDYLSSVLPVDCTYTVDVDKSTFYYPENINIDSEAYLSSVDNVIAVEISSNSDWSKEYTESIVSSLPFRTNVVFFVPSQGISRRFFITKDFELVYR